MPNCPETVPKLTLSVDEEETRLAHLDHRAIAAQLEASLEGAVGGSVLEATEELPIRVRVAETQRSGLAQIGSLDLLPTTGPLTSSPRGERTNDYAGIPLAALAEIELKPELAVVPRLNGRRMNEVQAYITAGVLPAEVLERFEKTLAASDYQLPPGYTYELGGEGCQTRRSDWQSDGERQRPPGADGRHPGLVVWLVPHRGNCRFGGRSFNRIGASVPSGCSATHLGSWGSSARWG